MTIRDLVEQINIQGNIVIREIENGETPIDLVHIEETDMLWITDKIEPYADRPITFMYTVTQLKNMPTLIIEIAEED